MPRPTTWAAPGFEDTSLRWKTEPEVKDGSRFVMKSREVTEFGADVEGVHL